MDWIRTRKETKYPIAENVTIQERENRTGQNLKVDSLWKLTGNWRSQGNNDRIMYKKTMSIGLCHRKVCEDIGESSPSGMVAKLGSLR